MRLRLGGRNEDERTLEQETTTVTRFIPSIEARGQGGIGLLGLRLDARGVFECSMSSECVTLISKYLAGGERDGFGRRDPFRRFSGGGAAEGLARLLASGVTEDDCPDEDNRYSAMLFGSLVGSAKLEPSDLRMIKFFMEEAYNEHVPSFNKGMAIAKEERRSEEPKSGSNECALTLIVRSSGLI